MMQSDVFVFFFLCFFFVFFSDFLCKSICCGYPFELHRQVNAIQMGNHNICLYKEEDKKYTGCNLKTIRNCLIEHLLGYVWLVCLEDGFLLGAMGMKVL